jgi:pyruvate dehydrogenase E2 component (dihydrolipoamide acetyltransferase)
MSRPFVLPDLGEGLTEAEIVKVLVNEGDVVAEDAPLIEVETDKATVEIPSPVGGRVARIHVQPGQTVKVGDVLVTFDSAGVADASGPRGGGGGRGRGASEPHPPRTPPAAPRTRESVAATGDVAQHSVGLRAERAGDGDQRSVAPRPERGAMSRAQESGAAPGVAERVGPVPATPATRRLARELGVDLRAVSATGPGGRVTDDDVRAAAGTAATPAR